MKIQLYSKSHTVNEWVKVITEKFNDIPFMTREKDIGTILSVTSKSELKKINTASLEEILEYQGVLTEKKEANV
jgi:mevalonate pyrophosphate decarboxylase